MTTNKIDSYQKLQNNLLAESGFWDLLRITLKIKFNTENALIPLVVFIFVFLCNLFGELGSDNLQMNDVASSAKDLVGWYYTILGFLVAGYTIFASVTSIKSSIRMAQLKEEQTGLPYLKYLHAIFFKTIIVFFLASFLSLITVIIFRKHGFLGVIYKSVHQEMHYILSFFDAINIALFFLSLMLLKSFLYNIYSAVMTAVALGIQEEIDMLEKPKKYRKL